MLTAQSFMEIISKDELAVKDEMQVFHYVLRWGRAKCEGLKSVEYEQKFRSILNQVLPCIRFTHMGLEEFMDQVYPTHLLSDTLLAKIIPNLHKPGTPGTVKEIVRHYWKPFATLPAEMLVNIFINLEMPDLLLCRLVCRRFKNLIEDKFTLSIKLTDQKLTEIGYIEPKSHAFSQFKFQTQTFTESLKLKLISCLLGSTNKLKLLLELDVNQISDYQILFSFLQQTSGITNLKLHLNVSSISNALIYESYKGHSKFVQLTHLTFESFALPTELQCLTEIVQNAPNLKEISIGSFILRPIESVNAQAAHFLTNFKAFRHLDTNSKLNDVTISIANLDLRGDLNLNLFRELYQRNVLLKKVYFHDDWKNENIDLVDIFCENIEEVFGVHMHQSTPCFKRVAPKVTGMCVGCSPRWIMRVLDKTPNLEKLMWSHFPWENTEPLDNGGALKLLPNLHQLNVKIYREEDLEGIRLLCIVGPNVKVLKLWIGCSCSISATYDFQNVEQLTLMQEGGLSVENLTGFSESQLQVSKGKMDTLERPPFIGSLKNLSVLSFGLLDYQSEAWSWRWRIKMAALKYGIGHAQNIRQIIFPPMKLGGAKRTLDYLSLNMTKLKCVKFQVWASRNQNVRNGTIVTKQVEEFQNIFSNFFRVEAIEVMEQDGIKHPVFK